MSDNATSDSTEVETTQEKVSKQNPIKSFFVLVLIVLGVWIIFYSVSALFDDTLRLIAPAGNIKVEVAATTELRTKGLSGHKPLSESEGMLFVFDSASTENCFWMKDMTFPIDMVWLDEEKHVVTVVPAVTPETYPNTFCPDLPAKYGLEIAAGRAKELGIVPDEQLSF